MSRLVGANMGVAIFCAIYLFVLYRSYKRVMELNNLHMMTPENVCIAINGNLIIELVLLLFGTMLAMFIWHYFIVREVTKLQFDYDDDRRNHNEPHDGSHTQVVIGKLRRADFERHYQMYNMDKGRNVTWQEGKNTILVAYKTFFRPDILDVLAYSLTATVFYCYIYTLYLHLKRAPKHDYVIMVGSVYRFNFLLMVGSYLLRLSML